METPNDKHQLSPNDDYLWDQSGEPDAEIQKLETLLANYRHERPAPDLPELAPRRWSQFPLRMRLFPALVAAAAIALVGIGTFLIESRKTSPAAVPGFLALRTAGDPRIGTKVIGSETSQLAVGQVLETDAQSRATLQATDTGQIEIEPSTRLRLLAMNATQKQIALDRGTIHAYIWAPAGQFVVDTPSATTVDLGCAYTLHVDESGAGVVRTTVGWVGFKLNGHESFIPAGAACATRPKVGPGTPYFDDASEPFRSALDRFDFEDTSPEQRAADLKMVLNQSRPRDALTLWHLLSRVDENQRSLVYDRLQQYAPAPAGVTREGILRLEQPMLDLWWNALGFDDISVWRHWEHSWAEANKPAGIKAGH